MWHYQMIVWNDLKKKEQALMVVVNNNSIAKPPMKVVVTYVPIIASSENGVAMDLAVFVLCGCFFLFCTEGCRFLWETYSIAPMTLFWMPYQPLSNWLLVSQILQYVQVG